MKERINSGFSIFSFRILSGRLPSRTGRLWFLLGIVLFWLTSSPIISYGQQKPISGTANTSARDDRSPIRVRYPEADHLRDLQTDHDYQYGNDTPPPENPIARFFNWLFRKLAQFLSSKAYQNVWQYVILAAIACFVIYLLMKAEVLGFLFPKKAQSGALDYENLAENIHEIDFETAIDEAAAARNFRLAVRLLYLQTLKRLTDAGRVHYKPDKTNRQYVAELINSPLQPDFETLTRQFEFVWYGDFPVDEQRFQAIQNQFRQFNQAPLAKAINPIP
ncbi:MULTISPECIES: DUF4129 domain-containing protein [unclassified Spirosoma]|uniref:DUF4129 domain-containing protein n=1 Tax=unclassified Spirosoma TaxID=2621999 RepID=UPI0009590336|nr:MULTISPECIES: DUF4129 domain-containing protein [unclassified Spirosoma]MBN8824129.1 DUF4129 domain-containing protein [Spirosoma sp.]OJW78870.1 MAG: hypothetical protein BGO59_10380 [Spirosoma sp. 48-14]